MKINQTTQIQLNSLNIPFLKTGILALFFLFSCINSFATVKTYGSPGDLSLTPHLKQSADYTVTVNGRSSFVYETDNYWDGGGNPIIRRMETKAAFTNFDFGNEVANVEVTCNFPINSVTIRPKSDNVSFTQTGNKISFSISKSKYLSVEINDRLKPLFIFADSLFVPPVAPAITYGPGIHNIGPQVALAPNQTVYIAGGAVVNGSFTSKGGGLKIVGRGILNCGGIAWSDWLLDKTLSPIAAVGGTMSGYELRGFTMVNAAGWYTNAYGPLCNIQDLKCIAWCGNSDGPHLNGDSKMTHCFIFNNDDALISNKGDNNTFRDCVVWGGYWGHTMISLADNSQDNLLWEDIDIIGAQPDLTFKVGKMISIETSLDKPTVPPTAIKNHLTFRNIRIEGQLPDKAGLVYMGVLGTSVIKNVLIENVTTELLRTTDVDAEGTIEIMDAGAKIDSITFKGLRMNGTLISKLYPARIKLYGVGGVMPTHVIFDNTGYTGIEEVFTSNNTPLKVYVSNNRLRIEADNVTFNSFSVFNIVGAKVKSGSMFDNDISNLPAGIYNVLAEVDGVNYVGKFLKQ